MTDRLYINSSQFTLYLVHELYPSKVTSYDTVLVLGPDDDDVEGLAALKCEGIRATTVVVL